MGVGKGGWRGENKPRESSSGGERGIRLEPLTTVPHSDSVANQSYYLQINQFSFQETT